MARRKFDSGPTIWDVAKECNVSIATVSQVLNNGPRPVRPDTRERVITAAKKLNYHPNAMARGLVSRRMNTIGVVSGVFNAVDVVGNPYAASVLRGILAGAAASGFGVLLFTQWWEDLQNSGSVYRDRRADGVVAIAPADNNVMISGMVAFNMPVVAISGDCLSLGVPSVDVDNAKGARIAAQHFVHLGHKRVAHITGNAHLVATRLRRGAFIDTLDKAGIEVPDRYIRVGHYNGSGAYEHAASLLSEPDPPTAIFAGNDSIALLVLQAAHDLGVRVPEDLSVIGFDDIGLADHSRPALTTVRQPLASVGEMAAKLLIARVESGSSEPQLHLIDPDLTVRETTAPPRPGR